jgi:hypothetical protein
VGFALRRLTAVRATAGTLRNWKKPVDNNKKIYYKQITEDNMDNLYEYLAKEYNAHFAGWDFSYLDGRMEQDSLPWD